MQGTQACLLMCIPTGAVVIGASVFVLILDIGHPAELRAFIFYAEVRVCLCVHAFLPASACLYICVVL